MSRQAPSSRDDTVVLFSQVSGGSAEPLPFTPVAVAPGSQAPRHIPYLAQQTSFDQYTPGLNPLVNAASVLLMEIICMKTSQDTSLDVLRARLEAEMRGFYAQATALGISEAQVSAAQYLLCTALDESITSSPIPGGQSDWQQHSLLSTFHKDTWGGEVFFDVLNRAMEQPASRLYLLELIYLLLSLGYEGKYRLQDRGPLALEMLRDQLYRQIRLLRGDSGPDLAKKIAAREFRQKTFAYVPLWLVGATVAFCLAVTFWAFSSTLEGKAAPLLAQFMGHAPVGKPFAPRPPAAEAMEEGQAASEAPVEEVPADDAASQANTGEGQQ